MTVGILVGQLNQGSAILGKKKHEQTPKFSNSPVLDGRNFDQDTCYNS